MGNVANAKMRKLRIQAHDAFDPLWLGDDAPMTRLQAYSWLAMKLNIPLRRCHISLMSEAELHSVIRIAKHYE